MSRENSFSRDFREVYRDSDEYPSKMRERKQSIKISNLSTPYGSPSTSTKPNTGSTFLNVLRRGSKIDSPQPQEKKPPPRKQIPTPVPQLPKKPVKEAVGKYLLGEGLGRGQFGQVFRGVDSENGSSVAIKQMKLGQMDEASMTAFEAEVELLKKLNHDNIIKYHTSVRTTDHLNLVIEYADGGSITSILKKFGSFPEKLCAVYILQCLKGLQYLHSQSVVHRDIKGANLLLTKSGKVKLADFGISTTANTPTGGEAGFGSPYWMAPEVIEMEVTPNEKADIWSLGCTIIELLTGHPPYHEYHPMGAIVRCVQDDHPPLPPNISKEMEDFLLKCFQKDRDLRASASELMQHPWFTSMKNEIPTTPSETSSSMLEDPDLDLNDSENRLEESPIESSPQAQSIRFNGESIRSDAPFKSLYLTGTTTCAEVVQLLLDRYHSKAHPSSFAIFLEYQSEKRQLEDNDYPVYYMFKAHQNPSKKELPKFFIRPRPEHAKRKEGTVLRFGKKLMVKGFYPVKLIVDTENRYIAFYGPKDPSDDSAEPSKVIYNLKMVKEVFENVNNPQEGIYEFIFDHRGEKHILRAQNNEEMTSWISIIKDATTPAPGPQTKDQATVKKDRQSIIDPNLLGLGDGIKRGRLRSNSSAYEPPSKFALPPVPPPQPSW